MIFNSLAFFVFFPVITVVYFLLPHRLRWGWLLAASCVFYMAFIPAYIFILVATILVDYAAGLAIEPARGKRRKLYLVISIISNIGFLAFFKYYGFAQETLASLAHLLDWNYALPVLRIVLPIGLSFHTFQALAYTIEVYRGNQKAERHLGIYALYVMFYPQLVAGPIERPQSLLPQFREEHRFDAARVASGLRLMLWGFFKKLVIADNAAAIVNRVFDYPTEFHGLPLVVATLLFAWQIYCDFSGYSDIALGAAEVMGFRLMQNFNRPYASRSVAEFWRRWHISLSSWFRDYVYIPLGGNRVSKMRLSLNMLIVFFLSGLWHGAAWTYVVWGLMLGSFLVVSLWTKPFRDKLVVYSRLAEFPRAHAGLKTALTFALIVLSWIMFRAHTFADARFIFLHLCSGFSDVVRAAHPLSTLAAALGVSVFACANITVAILFMEGVQFLARNSSLSALIAGREAWVRYSLYIFLMLWIILFGYFGERPFIYFQF